MARKAAAGLLALWILGALAAPWLAPHPYTAQDLSLRLRPPSAGHWLGTDDLGRDVLSRALYGSRVSLAIVALAVALALTLGSALGVLAGYFGGLADHLVGRLVDVLMALPGILLAITIIAYVGRGFSPLILALSVTAWVGYARLARSTAISLKSREFVQASRAAGARPVHVLVRHVLPHTAAILIVQATAGAASVMLSEAGLSFLGLGVQPPTPSWGAMLATGCDYLLEAPHLAMVPGLLLFGTVWALNTVGEALSGGLSSRGKTIVVSV